MSALQALWEIPGALAAVKGATPTTAPLLDRAAALLRDPALSQILGKVADLAQAAKQRDLPGLIDRAAEIAHGIEKAGLLDKVMVLLADAKVAAPHLADVAVQAAHLLRVLNDSGTPAEAAKKLAAGIPDRAGNPNAGG